MNVIKVLIRSIVTLSLGCGLVVPLLQTAKADSIAFAPPIIQTGFTLYASGGPEAALIAWRKGGLLLEADKKVAPQIEDFKQVEKSFGNYKSCELVEAKEIGANSKIVYVSMNFERGAAYMSFLVYKTSKDWVVQNMEFNTKPEAIMPWLALRGGK
jgi:hypothetical protein